jgi:hypothetical protein
MGGYGITHPMVYVVGWRDAGVIKNGFSTRQRWRKFLLNGAELIALYEFPGKSGSAGMFESYLEQRAGFLYPRAFRTKTEDAAKLLGPDCSGYLECFRADVDDWAALLPKHCGSSNAQALRIA